MEAIRSTHGGSRAVAAFVVSAAYGAAIWAVSPIVTGQAEPWDSGLVFYLIAISLGGLAALIRPRAFWVVPLGLMTGQAVYMLAALPMSNLGPLVLFPLAIMVVPGALVAVVVRVVAGRGAGANGGQVLKPDAGVRP